MTGSSIASIMSILAAPLLARLYSPEAFGDLSLYMAVVTIAATFLTLRYEPAIMLPEKENEAISLTVLSMGIAVTFSIILSLSIVTIGEDKVFALAKLQHIARFFPFIAISALSLALFQSISVYINRCRQYRTLSLIKVLDSFSKMFTSVAAAYIVADGLIWSSSISFVASALSIFYILYRAVHKNTGNIKISLNIKAAAKKYADFPKYNILSDTLNVFTANMHIMLFFAYFGNDIAGTVSFASKLLLVPLGIISTSFSQIFYQQISKIDSKMELMKTYKSSFLITLAVAASLIIGVSIVPEKLIVLLFGEQWVGLSTYLVPMGWWFGIHFCGSSLSTLYTKLRKLNWLFTFNIINALFTALSIYGGHYFGQSAHATLTIFATGRVILYSTLCVLGFFLINNTPLKNE